MSSIIVAFSRRENAVNIRNILVKSGLEVSAVCQTGAKVLQYAEVYGGGIVICSPRMQDMHYTQMREYLPDTFEILLIAPADKWTDSLPDGVVGLPMPLKLYDLVNTIGMIQQSQCRRRRRRRETPQRRDEAERRIIEQAKQLLIERNHMSEEEAHRYVQKTSMESGTDMVETARMILTVMEK